MKKIVTTMILVFNFSISAFAAIPGRYICITKDGKYAMPLITNYDDYTKKPTDKSFVLTTFRNFVVSEVPNYINISTHRCFYANTPCLSWDLWVYAGPIGEASGLVKVQPNADIRKNPPIFGVRILSPAFPKAEAVCRRATRAQMAAIYIREGFTADDDFDI